VTAVELQLSPIEADRFDVQHDAFVAALGEEGFSVSRTPGFGHEVSAITVTLLTPTTIASSNEQLRKIRAAALTSLHGQIRGGRKPRLRRVFVYHHRGDYLLQIVVPDNTNRAHASVKPGSPLFVPGAGC
jgi:hypothetical protein